MTVEVPSTSAVQMDIMRVNVEKVEIDSKLSELDQRADNLQEGASQFHTQVQAVIFPANLQTLFAGISPCHRNLKEYLLNNEMV